MTTKRPSKIIETSLNKKLIIIDLSNFIFRAYYAIRPLNTPDGTPVNAVHGVLSMLLKLLEEHRPDHLILACDTKENSFRHEIYEGYKANRDGPPEDLIPQFDLINQLVKLLEIPQIKMPGYEADDIMGSLATQFHDKFEEIYIATSDKDIMQFVSDQNKVYILDTMKDKIFKEQDVFDKFQVHTHQMVDYLSMMGDASDNIPGMRGIGAKGAAKLLGEYGDLENCHKNRDKLTNKRLVNAFSDHYEDGLLSKSLVEIVTDLDIQYEDFQARYHLTINDELLQFLAKLGIKRNSEKLKELAQKLSHQSLEKEEEKVKAPTLKINEVLIEKTLAQLLSFSDFFIQVLEKDFYISTKDTEDIFLIKDHHLKVSFLQKVSLDSKKKIIGFCLKDIFKFMIEYELPLSLSYFDIGIAHYLLREGRKHDFITCFNEFFKTEAPLPEEKTFYYQKIANELQQSLIDEELEHIYNELEIPLIKILAQMEFDGIQINIKELEKIEAEVSKELVQIEETITSFSNEKINLKSPKQVAQFLFEELKLPTIKKIKTGQSTDSEVLEELARQNLHPVPAEILRFRELDKLMSTYLKAMPKLVDQNTNRIHTTFRQDITATGRLSSENPNLQNIPIRTDDGKKIRKAFEAKKGFVLISADYSQVELRLLAHFSQDPYMIKAFNHHQDIHAQTASEVLGVPLEQITSSQRSLAKTVNFGLMYGQSSFGLAKTLKISRKEAKDYIDLYFEKFSKIKEYLQSLKDLCQENGYAITLLGRKRNIPEIRSQNRMIKSNAERMAINTPIQGTAADLLKKAMIDIQKELHLKGFKTKIILQIHDELIFEAPKEESQQVISMVREKMESVYCLSVPFKVDISMGENWLELNQ